MPVKISSVPNLAADGLPPILSEEQAATALGVTVSQLRRLSYRRLGPRMVKIGGVRVITRQALEEWLLKSAR